MRKEIYHATVHYRWRTLRFVKGVEKPAKKWKEATHRTCITELNPEDLQNVKHFIRSLEIKHKSTNDIQIKIDRITDQEFICMSHDVH
tara:strand:- start:59 stop:322 length:264 start_codon:yes stop_codon:yes gene_type:complete